MSRVLLCSQVNDRRFVLFTQDPATHSVYPIGFSEAEEARLILDDERAWALIGGGAILRALTVEDGHEITSWTEGCSADVQIPLGRPGFAFLWVKVPDADWERGAHFRPRVH